MQITAERAKCQDEFRQIIATLVKDLRARGPPLPGDVSVAAQLMRVHDPLTGTLSVQSAWQQFDQALETKTAVFGVW